jgi:hypothetical protein
MRRNAQIWSRPRHREPLLRSEIVATLARERETLNLGEGPLNGGDGQSTDDVFGRQDEEERGTPISVRGRP